MWTLAQSIDALALAFFAILVVVPPASAQVGYDRPGGDYASFTIRNGDPAVCAAHCDRDRRCRAWSFAYPHTVHLHATCRLKNRVPSRVADQCCVTGVRGGGVVEPRLGPFEFGIARRGHDYRSFDLPSDPTGQSCKSACESEERCRAWTYVRPGYYGRSAARCHLKSQIPRPLRRPCCISGVVR